MLTLRILFLLMIVTASGWAEDKITKQDGSSMTGTVLGVEGAQVQLKLEAGTIGLPLADIKSVEMEMPPALAAAKNGTPDQILAVAGPLVEKFKGLPAEWIPRAMAMMGNAYAVQKDFVKSAETFAEIKQVYGNMASSSEASVGMARLAVLQGKPDEALGLLQPIVDQAQQALPHSVSEAEICGTAFLLKGQALEAKGDAPGALEAYLTTNLFTQDPSTLQAASQQTTALLADHPGLAVP